MAPFIHTLRHEIELAGPVHAQWKLRTSFQAGATSTIRRYHGETSRHRARARKVLETLAFAGMQGDGRLRFRGRVEGAARGMDRVADVDAAPVLNGVRQLIGSAGHPVRYRILDDRVHAVLADMVEGLADRSAHVGLAGRSVPDLQVLCRALPSPAPGRRTILVCCDPGVDVLQVVDVRGPVFEHLHRGLDNAVLERVVLAYELAAIEGLDSLLHPAASSDAVALRSQAGAFRAFDLCRGLAIPSDDLPRVFHILRLASLAYIGDRWSDLRRWLMENPVKTRAPHAANVPWDKRVLYRVYDGWLRLFRKDSWNDLLAGRGDDDFEWNPET